MSANAKLLKRNGTGDNTAAEQNAAYDAETAVRAYLRGVRL